MRPWVTICALGLLLAVGLLTYRLFDEPVPDALVTSDNPGTEVSAHDPEIQAQRRENAAVLEESREAVTRSPRELAADYVEIDGLAWIDLTTMESPGVLSGRVLRGNMPLADRRVRLWGKAIGAPPQGLGVVGPGARETRSDAAGAFHFEGLPGGYYTVRADDEDEHIELPNVKLVAGRRTRSVLLLFGRSVIEGAVYSAEGLALPSVRVRAAGIGPEHARSVSCLTDGEGRFLLSGLIAGRYHVIAEPPGEWSADRERQVRVGITDRAIVYFGNPEKPVRWAASLVDDLGDTVPGRRTLNLVHAERRDEIRLFVENDGSFDAEIQPGRWLIHAANGLHRGLYVSEIELAGELVQTPLRFPGRITIEPRPGLACPPPSAFLLAGGSLKQPTPPEGPYQGVLQWAPLDAGKYTLVIRDKRLAVGGAEDGKTLEIQLTSEQRSRKLEVWRR